MSCGHHEAAWRLPESDPSATPRPGPLDRTWPGSPSAARSTRSSWPTARRCGATPSSARRGALEPTVLLTALAGATSRIGLIATASTTYNAPVQPGPPVRLAGPRQRRAGRLEHRHHGRPRRPRRTSASTTARPRRSATARAAEFTDVSIRLWDSWEDGAELGDKAAGVYADDSRIHPVDYAGRVLQGPRARSTCPRSPQGRPLLVQAGSSQDGREFAARYAEAVFTAQQTLADAQEFYADMKARARRLGRDPDQVKILPGIVPVIGSTEAEARALERRARGADHPRVRPGPAGQGARGAGGARWNWTGRCPRRCTAGRWSRARRAGSS